MASVCSAAATFATARSRWRVALSNEASLTRCAWTPCTRACSKSRSEPDVSEPLGVTGTEIHTEVLESSASKPAAASAAGMAQGATATPGLGGVAVEAVELPEAERCVP